MAKKSKASGSRNMGISPSMPESKTVSVRKIENGFIVNESGYQRDKYFSRDTFMPKAPQLLVPPKSKK